ncbi:uracil-DNA glycosylase-like isoform X2 [Macrosteles quadrilineatus]|uniref:uracil-DNA glycosylase-like isoform X2 n=1 Tax=Macrosteles quadrilineatus TaxID=74068 RepID=UPI0023E10C52|nr:uracil-DNA glycosylase-like isoform X2 [Macrosteles quadrilineatus]
MSHQKTIKAFFQPSIEKKAPKRNISDVENIDNTNVRESVKILKSNNDEELRNADPTNKDESKPSEEKKLETVVSEEMALRIANNKLSAELKLMSKTHPALHSNVGLTWFEALKDEFSKPYFKKLSKFLVEERQKTTPIFPRPEEVWTWTRECRVDEVKAVILGQDPYHHPGQAHGLSFSVPVGVSPPPSLLNMYKELENDIGGFKRPGHGYLIGWARQGVLLLNAVLTVKCRTPNSHKDQGWEKLTDAVIKHLNTNGKGIVFLLWGSYAQKKAEFLDQCCQLILKRTRNTLLSKAHCLVLFG